MVYGRSNNSIKICLENITRRQYFAWCTVAYVRCINKFHNLLFVVYGFDKKKPICVIAVYYSFIPICQCSSYIMDDDNIQISVINYQRNTL